MSDSNANEVMKDYIGGLFDRCASAYDSPSLRFVPYCADALVEAAKLRPGERMLDVGTGTGALAISAVQRLLPEGRVQGIDLSERMIEKAHENINKNGLGRYVDLFDMDAGDTAFRKDYFDIIAGSHSFTWLPDPQAALKGWLKILKPGGRVALTVFREEAFSPMLDDLTQDALAMGLDWGMGADTDNHPLNIRRYGQGEELRNLFVDAGFMNVEVQERSRFFHLPRADDWWEIVMNSGIRNIIERLPAADYAKLRLSHLEEVDKRLGEDGLKVNFSYRILTAQRAQEIAN